MKKGITIGIIVAVCVGFAYWLFTLSPQNQSTGTPSAYTLDTGKAKPLSAVPQFDPATEHYAGNPKAKNVFIEYGDVQCPACASYNDMLKKVPTEFTDTVFVFRFFPLTQIHKNAVEGALANEAAGAQGKFWEMHDVLFQKQSEWENLSDPLDKFTQYARQAGVGNIDQFKSDVTGQKYKTIIEQDNNQALGLSLRGTPTFFFNGHQLQNDDIAGMKKQAEQWVNK